jgi:capsid protein
LAVPVHPGHRPVSTLPKGGRSSRAADDIAHVFELRRDQDRGEPWGVAAMASLKDLGTYEEAEVMRKQIEACTVGVVTGEDPEPRLGGTVSADEERQFGIFDGSGFGSSASSPACS